MSNNIEIERKFLVTSDRWMAKTYSKKTIIQGYMSVQPAVRVRLQDNKALITIKSSEPGMTRSEFEYEIPYEDGVEMTKKIEMGLIEKTRYYVHDADLTWEIDVFHGDNEGLVVAEIELPSEDTEIPQHSWLGKEVTDASEYYNAHLSVLPYRLWKDYLIFKY